MKIVFKVICCFSIKREFIHGQDNITVNDFLVKIDKITVILLNLKIIVAFFKFLLIYFIF